jgi:hypothetical protein
MSLERDRPDIIAWLKKDMANHARNAQGFDQMPIYRAAQAEVAERRAKRAFRRGIVTGLVAAALIALAVWLLGAIAGHAMARALADVAIAPAIIAF